MHSEIIHVGVGIDRGGTKRIEDSVEELRLTAELEQKTREGERLTKKISELRESVYGLCALVLLGWGISIVTAIHTHRERKDTNERFAELRHELKSRTIPSPPTHTVAPPSGLGSQPYEQDIDQR